MREEIIAAISTAQGQGGIGAIRVSGFGSIDLVDRIFHSRSGILLKDLSGYTARMGKIYDEKEELDEVVVLVYRNPHSYTGEDVVEIFCHGGLYVTKKILRLVFEKGARPANPGEFTKRAFLNGKIDLIKAESVMKIISATGKNAMRAAVAANDGVVSRKIEQVKDILVETLAQLSVWADYPDDDDFDVDYNSLKEKITDAKEKLIFLINNYDAGKILINGVNTVIAGAPNVGKSTLMNMLAGVEKSIVTEIPGTTRDIVEETVSLGDVTLHISDTAGIHATEDPVESIGVKRAKNRLKEAELILFVVDGSRNLTNDEIEMINSLKENNLLIIVNKSDLPQRLDYSCFDVFSKAVIKISAKNVEGLDMLEKSILEILGKTQIDPAEGILISERQFLTLKNATKALSEAIDAINSGLTLDAVTVSIDSALDELCVLTGEKASQKVVDEIFSKFCVGK